MTNNLSKGTFAFVLSLTVAAITMLQPASARDRPGTPNQESLTACGYSQNLKPTLCGSFINTASEKVRFEMEAKRNNVPISVQTECFVPVRGGPGLNGRVGCYDPLVEVQNPGTSSTDPHTGKNVPDRLVLSFKMGGRVRNAILCAFSRKTHVGFRRVGGLVQLGLRANARCTQAADQPAGIFREISWNADIEQSRKSCSRREGRDYSADDGN